MALFKLFFAACLTLFFMMSINSLEAKRIPQKDIVIPSIEAIQKVLHFSNDQGKEEASNTFDYTCYPEDADACVANFSLCVDGSSSEHVICPCYQIFGQCLLANGCLNDKNASDSFTLACESFGCEYDQCHPTSVTSSSSSSSTSSGTTGSTTSATTGGGVCSDFQISNCLDQYQQCTNDSNTLCDCLGLYGYCLYEAGTLAKWWLPKLFIRLFSQWHFR